MKQKDTKGTKNKSRDGYIYVVITDATTDGYYGNNADAILFRTKESALDYIEEEIQDLIQQEVNDRGDIDFDTLKERRVVYYEDGSIQYMCGETIKDWEIQALRPLEK